MRRTGAGSSVVARLTVKPATWRDTLRGFDSWPPRLVAVHRKQPVEPATSPGPALRAAPRARPGPTGPSAFLRLASTGSARTGCRRRRGGGSGPRSQSRGLPPAGGLAERLGEPQRGDHVAHPLVHRAAQLLADQRAVDVALVEFDDRVRLEIVREPGPFTSLLQLRPPYQSTVRGRLSASSNSATTSTATPSSSGEVAVSPRANTPCST